MSVSRALLGLLKARPSYGYELKRAHDALFVAERPVAYGQVYSTLGRLLRNGLVSVDGTEAGEGPDRKRYAITDAGAADVDAWLSTPENPRKYLYSTLHTKVVLALLCHRDAVEILDVQRAEHCTAAAELNRRKRSGDLVDQLICEHALLHLEAELKWLEAAASRLSDLAEHVDRHGASCYVSCEGQRGSGPDLD